MNGEKKKSTPEVLLNVPDEAKKLVRRGGGVMDSMQ